MLCTSGRNVIELDLELVDDKTTLSIVPPMMATVLMDMVQRSHTFSVGLILT